MSSSKERPRAPAHLPSKSSAFVGRSAELSRLEALIESQPLVSVVGPGGVGKTRLVSEYGHRRPPIFCRPGAGGIWFVDLSDARTLLDLVRSVGARLEVPLTTVKASGEAIERLGLAIERRGQLLLVLDNMEQLAEHAQATLGRWIDAAPRARFLVTSRERLRLDAEAVLELTPLGLPDDRDPDRSQEALELLIDRIKSFDRRFEANSRAERDSLEEIVRRLDGLPLAIELAAARVESLGLDALLARLDQPLDLLSRPSRGDRNKQDTLRGAIAWSWNLLSAEERSALAQCAVFRGGFSVAAAEAVIQTEGNALDRLELLREQSLLSSEAVPGLLGERRFSFLESIRAFAEEQLEAGPQAQAARDRHRDFFLRLGASWAQAIDGREGPSMLRRLALEEDNLIAIQERALSAVPPDAESALSALLALNPLVTRRGPFMAQKQALEAALSLAAEHPVSPALLRAARAEYARVLQLLGASEAAALLEAVKDDAEKAGDLRLVANLSLDLGVAAHRLRDLERAERRYREGLERFASLHDRRGEGRALGNLAAIEHDRGDFERARPSYLKALERLRLAEDLRLEGIFLTNLGVLEAECGRLIEARHTYVQAVAILRTVGDQRLLGITLGNLGVLLHRLSELAEAQATHEQSAEMLAQVGDRRSEAIALARLGAVRASRAEIDRARRDFDEAERLLASLADPLAQATLELYRGFVDAALRSEALDEERVEEARAYGQRAEARFSASEAWCDRSDEIRTARTLLADALQTRGSRGAEPANPGALLIAAGARWFCPPGGTWQDFRRRAAIRRLLFALAEARRTSPGVALSVERLIEAGWPGQKIDHQASKNRLYVALATLRSLGLREALASRDDGYLLDPRVPLEWREPD